MKLRAVLHIHGAQSSGTRSRSAASASRSRSAASVRLKPSSQFSAKATSAWPSSTSALGLLASDSANANCSWTTRVSATLRGAAEAGSGGPSRWR
jgi:hypothetical protein